MPNRRKGAPGSFGAPLDELIPKLGSEQDNAQIKVDVHRRPEASEEAPIDRCRIFMLNQRLYELANERRRS